MSFVERYALTEGGRFPYIGPSWKKIDVEPKLFLTLEDAEEMRKALLEKSDIDLCVMLLRYDLNDGKLKSILSEKFPKNWNHLHEYIVGHKILIDKLGNPI